MIASGPLGAEVMDIDLPNRTLLITVCPFGIPSYSEFGEGGLVRVDPGAFDNHLAQRPADLVIRVNRDHDKAQTVGRAMELINDPKSGLACLIKIARSALGEETFELAADGALAGSTAMYAPARGTTWDGDVKVIKAAAIDRFSLIPAAEPIEERRVGDVIARNRAQSIPSDPNLAWGRIVLPEWQWAAERRDRLQRRGA